MNVSGLRAWLAVCAMLAACGGQSTGGGGGDAAAVDDFVEDAAGEAGGSGLDPYGDCVGRPRRVDDTACAGPLTCLPMYGAASGEGQWCAAPCDPARDAGDCPARPAGSTSTVLCRRVESSTSPAWCVLSCQFDHDGCPRGMICHSGFTCVWPR